MNNEICVTVTANVGMESIAIDNVYHEVCPNGIRHESYSVVAPVNDEIVL